MKNLLPIGRFSRMCRLTVKALRHYDELGLLRPAMVDPDSGYRYYSPIQAVEANRIRLLRELEMPLEEIRAVINERDSQRVQQLVGRHRDRIQERVQRYGRVLDLLHKLTTQEGDMDYQVKVKQMEPQHVLSVRTNTTLARMQETFGAAFGQLFGYLGRLGVKPAGPPFAVYHDPEFREDDIDVEICVPVERRVTGDASMRGWQSPAGTAACTIHAGSYDEVHNAYAALTPWIQAQGHAIAGPPREVYLVGPGEADDPAEYRTEILFPLEG